MVFLSNGYAWQEIKRLLASYDHKRKDRPEMEGDLIWYIAVVPYCNSYKSSGVAVGAQKYKKTLLKPTKQ